jgi:hypothetical protein
MARSVPVAGEKVLGGQVTVNLTHGQIESATQLLESLGSIENNSFIVAGKPIFVERSVGLLRLAANASWSFH